MARAQEADRVYRRTGITLKEGRRDEHGMEELDGVFSSPEKSPTEFNGLNGNTGNETTMGSGGMSLDEGKKSLVQNVPGFITLRPSVDFYEMN